MGGIEIAAALLGVINVLLVVKRSIWNYPVALFAWRGLGVTAALYALFLCLAVLGFVEWRRKARA